jgi:hypothetical protein
MDNGGHKNGRIKSNLLFISFNKIEKSKTKSNNIIAIIMYFKLNMTD